MFIFFRKYHQDIGQMRSMLNFYLLLIFLCKLLFVVVVLCDCNNSASQKFNDQFFCVRNINLVSYVIDTVMYVFH